MRVFLNFVLWMLGSACGCMIGATIGSIGQPDAAMACMVSGSIAGILAVPMYWIIRYGP